MLSYSQKLSPIRPGVRLRSMVRRSIVGALTLSGLPRFVVGRRIRSRLRRAPSENTGSSSDPLVGGAAIRPRMCIYAHFDTGNDLSEHDALFVSWLVSKGLGVVVVTTASLDNNADNLRKLRDSGVAVIQRANYGLDFASWAKGIEALGAGLDDVDQLFLINSSVYGPLSGDLDVFVPPTPTTHVYGLTSSREYVPHAHSYFLAFDKTAIRHPSFAAFFSSVGASTKKWSVIVDSELSWQRYFSRAGLETGTVFPPPQQLTINPLTRQWQGLIQAGFPFVKKSLFLQNYDGVDIDGWEDVIETFAGRSFVDILTRDIERRRAA